MRQYKVLGKSLLVLAIAVTAAVGFSAATAKAVIRPPAHCICPDVYAPVTCSNGVTYSNSCRASCAGATGCVPGGPRI
ncbi:MAG TPA: hypothetical protein VG797_02545 [Phycisphaerales bacterium]|nr:hypothetical protein [Phycisphaerales bacterium]